MQVIGRKESGNLVVYQAFNIRIAEFAIRHQQVGGSDYSFNRMSWIKPGFLWMMHRAGWGAKENQQQVLAITISLAHFTYILQQATISSYDKDLFETESKWKDELSKTERRLQWDPDHDPFGNKQERKAIQLGMKGDLLKHFCTEWIIKIDDITGFVRQQHAKVLANDIDNLHLPYEEVIDLNDAAIEKRTGIEKNER